MEGYPPPSYFQKHHSDVDKIEINGLRFCVIAPPSPLPLRDPQGVIFIVSKEPEFEQILITPFERFISCFDLQGSSIDLLILAKHGGSWGRVRGRGI